MGVEFLSTRFVLIMEIVGFSVITAALWWYRYRVRLSDRRLRLISVRMKLVQLIATGKLPCGNLCSLLDRATAASMDDERGLTLWTFVQATIDIKSKQPAHKAHALVDELDDADPEVQELVRDYANAEKALLLDRSPFLVFCVRFLLGCGHVAQSVKKAFSPMIVSAGKQNYKAYTFYDSVQKELLIRKSRPVHVLAIIGA